MEPKGDMSSFQEKKSTSPFQSQNHIRSQTEMVQINGIIQEKLELGCNHMLKQLAEKQDVGSKLVGIQYGAVQRVLLTITSFRRTAGIFL